LAGIEIAFALYTFYGVDFVDLITFENCFGGAFQFASTTGDAFFCNCHCHDLFLQMKKICEIPYLLGFIPPAKTHVNRKMSYNKPDNQRTNGRMSLERFFVPGLSGTDVLELNSSTSNAILGSSGNLNKTRKHLRYNFG